MIHLQCSFFKWNKDTGGKDRRIDVSESRIRGKKRWIRSDYIAAFVLWQDYMKQMN